MALHIGYEQVPLFALMRTDVPDEKARAAGQPPKCMLKAIKGEGRNAGSIVIDSETTLTGVPPEAWAYQLGNRCAIEWVLDQYKEKKPKDPTIRARFSMAACRVGRLGWCRPGSRFTVTNCRPIGRWRCRASPFSRSTL